MALDQAINELNETLGETRTAPQWRALVRLRLSAVREALADDRPRFRDGWLSARGAATDRDRHRLLARLSALTPRIGDRLDPESSYHEVRRLSVDLEHYRQRLHDLVYDSVGIELGGSE